MKSNTKDMIQIAALTALALSYWRRQPGTPGLRYTLQGENMISFFSELLVNVETEL